MTKVVQPESITTELEDYSSPILIKDIEFHLDLFSQKFLAKLASNHQDMLCFGLNAWTSTFEKRIGERKAWDLAGDVYRTVGVQAFPRTPYIPTLTDNTTLNFDDLNKDGLLKLIKLYWDQWLKHGVTWLNHAFKELGTEEAWKCCEEAYANIGRYQMPKIAELGGFSLDHVIGYVKANQLGIDSTQGYSRTFEIINDDCINIILYDCDVWGRYFKEGLYTPETAFGNCMSEGIMSDGLHGFPINKTDMPVLPCKNCNGKKPEGEAWCVWQIRRNNTELVMTDSIKTRGKSLQIVK